MNMWKYINLYCGLPEIKDINKEEIPVKALDLLYAHIGGTNRGACVTGHIIFDAYMASTYIIACRLQPTYRTKDTMKVYSWLEKVYQERALHKFTTWDKNLDVYVKIAMHGIKEEYLKELDNPFYCLMFAHMNKHCRDQADIFPSPELIALSWCKVMKMPPWAIPGLLTAVLHVELSKGTNIIRLRPLIWLTKHYYMQVFKRYDVPFANFHQTVIQALVSKNLYKLTRDSFYEYLNRRSWWLIEQLIEPTGYVTRFQLPVWDTAWSILALSSINASKLKYELCDFIKQVQQMDGGWAFTNLRHPSDNDDTSLALLALLECETTNKHILGAIDFLLSNQRKDGGWATYDRGNRRKPEGPLPSIRTNPWWTQIDVPVADITSHVILSLVRTYKITKNHKIRESIMKGAEWLYNDAIWDGRYSYFYGRWCQTFIPATASVVVALSEALKAGAIYKDKSDFEDLLESCVRWLKHNYANGCGEHFESYHCGKPVFTSPTIEHTSLAHIAFKSVGENVNDEVLLRVAHERMLEPCVNMAAFDVYVNTAMPYYLLLLALNGPKRG